ncbi:DUF3955 domain-containing protein [Intestinibacter sp.]
MKKYLTLFPFLVTIGCAIAYNIIGCRVLADGILDEPFFLVPIGWFFFFIGILTVLIQLIIYLKRRFFPKAS